MAPLKTISQAASLAITSPRILVAVDTCSSPPLSAINPSRICCPTLSSCSVGMLSSRRFLNGRQPVLEGVHVAWSRSCLSILPFRFFPRVRIHFPILVSLWQSNGKAETFSCVISWLDALRGLEVLVSSGFDLLAVLVLRVVCRQQTRSPLRDNRASTESFGIASRGATAITGPRNRISNAGLQ
jgi:hypothetical protein